ncbi:single-stranded DNA-binding protein [Truepera radiovictrix]|uniref:Single-stranded DNA-binding protein n=1 Tax=Truepera radiovictrix (strain DSM 17093 / CIP 108686 / LMG 22925 / RQ-24) TaxID=649638 RepID=D7CWQ9_TRURR|nr:single-stranded DNA-binding protein [Truepera radiovictrix]ADI13150.1 single-strand binding protein [Truepera radiovictrix DSM 17093]WMT58280.1 single-stranded DNA-binding protein [Truepera radiovictrix]
MARGLNSVQLIGTLTQAPDMKYTAGGLAILELNLAGNDHVVGSDGQLRELAWYHRVSVFGKQAEYLVDQLAAGTPVFVEGRLNYRAWEDASGQKRSALGINAVRVDVLTHGPRKGEPTVLDARGQERLKNALNHVTIIGNLIRDAELRYTPSGDAVTRFVVAVNEQYRDRSGQDQESVHFVEVNVWRELAESCAELAKGDPVLVIGRLVKDNWTDKDGNRQYKDKLEGSRVEYLTRGPGGGGASTRPQPAQQAVGAQRGQQSRPSPALDIDEEFPPEEDLPF